MIVSVCIRVAYGVLVFVTLGLPSSLPASELAKQTLTSSKGESFTILVSTPTSSGASIVLVHHWFGLSPFYEDAVRRLAKLGLNVVAVDLYD
jgi:hypothetical protein